MSDFYSNLAAVASRLLTDKGQAVTFVHAVDAAFDPILGAVTPGVAVNITGYGASFDYHNSEIDGTVIQRGDIRFLFEPTDPEPVNGDTVTVDSTVYRVMNVRPTKPDGTLVLLEAQLRV